MAARLLLLATLVADACGKDLNIGLFLPTDGWNCSDVKEAIFEAVNDINTAPPPARLLRPQHSIRIVYADIDPGCSSATAGKAAVDLLNAGLDSDAPLVLVGPGCSGSTVATVSLFQSFDLTLVSPSATNDQFSNTRTYPSFLRTASPDGERVKAVVTFMKSHSFMIDVQIISSLNLFNAGIASTMVHLITEAKGTVDLHSFVTHGGHDTVFAALDTAAPFPIKVINGQTIDWMRVDEWCKHSQQNLAVCSNGVWISMDETFTHRFRPGFIVALMDMPISTAFISRFGHLDEIPYAALGYDAVTAIAQGLNHMQETFGTAAFNTSIKVQRQRILQSMRSEVNFVGVSGLHFKGSHATNNLAAVVPVKILNFRQTGWVKVSTVARDKITSHSPIIWPDGTTNMPKITTCPPGTYWDTFPWHCLQCLSPLFSSSFNASSCDTCSSGIVKPSNAECVPCPSIKGIAYELCKNNRFDIPPQFLNASSEKEEGTGLYWSNETGETIYPCIAENKCAFTAAEEGQNYTSAPNSSLLGLRFFCQRNSTAPLCQGCLDGTVKMQGECTVCDSQSFSAWIGIMLLYIALMCMVYSYILTWKGKGKKGSAEVVFQGLVDFLQLAGALQAYSFHLSPSLKTVFTALYSIGSLDAGELSCLTASHTEQSLLLKMASILILCAGLIGFVILRHLPAFCVGSEGLREYVFTKEELHLSLPRALTFLYTLGAMRVAAGSFAVHDCQLVGQNWFLTQDTSIRCDAENEIYLRLRDWSIFAVVQLACLPALVVIINCTKRFSQTENTLSGKHTWDFLNDAYNPGHGQWYYAVVLVRKYLFVLVPVIVSDASQQMAFGNFIILSSLLIIVLVEPYKSLSANRMEKCALITISLALCIASAYFSSHPGLPGATKKMTMIEMASTMIIVIFLMTIIAYLAHLFFLGKHHWTERLGRESVKAETPPPLFDDHDIEHADNDVLHETHDDSDLRVMTPVRNVRIEMHTSVDDTFFSLPVVPAAPSPAQSSKPVSHNGLKSTLDNCTAGTMPADQHDEMESSDPHALFSRTVEDARPHVAEAPLRPFGLSSDGGDGVSLHTADLEYTVDLESPTAEPEPPPASFLKTERSGTVNVGATRQPQQPDGELERGAGNTGRRWRALTDTRLVTIKAAQFGPVNTKRA